VVRITADDLTIGRNSLLKEDRVLCDMRNSAEIRYVHSLMHPEYRDGLEVGCMCAEHTEQDRIGPRLREKRLRSRADRRKTWAKQVWKTSAPGNRHLNTRMQGVLQGWRSQNMTRTPATQFATELRSDGTRTDRGRFRNRKSQIIRDVLRCPDTRRDGRHRISRPVP
jgi:hypothetical protein